MHERWGNIPDISRQKSGRQSTDRRKSRRNSSQQPKQSKVLKRKCLKQIFHRHIQSEAIVNQVHKRRTFGSTFVYRSRCLGISRKSVPARSCPTLLHPLLQTDATICGCQSCMAAHPSNAEIKFSFPIPLLDSIFIHGFDPFAAV